jgi:hypothetical protein
LRAFDQSALKNFEGIFGIQEHKHTILNRYTQSEKFAVTKCMHVTKVATNSVAYKFRSNTNYTNISSFDKKFWNHTHI